MAQCSESRQPPLDDSFFVEPSSSWPQCPSSLSPSSSSSCSSSSASSPSWSSSPTSCTAVSPPVPRASSPVSFPPESAVECPVGAFPAQSVPCSGQVESSLLYWFASLLAVASPLKSSSSSSSSSGRVTWRPITSAMTPLLLILLFAFFTSSLVSPTEALKRRSPLHSEVIEEVEAKRLDKLIQETEFIAVLFCKYTLSLGAFSPSFSDFSF